MSFSNMMPRTTNLPIFGSLERLMLGIFEPYFEGTDVNVTPLFEEGMALPCVVARNDPAAGSARAFRADFRFLRPAILSVDTITTGINADDDAAILQEACRIAMQEAWEQQIVVPGVGYIAKIENSTSASRKSDWATSTGPVQYASLPRGATRYEANYRLLVRPDQDQANVDNPYVRHSSTF